MYCRVPWLMNLQVFGHNLIKWLPGESAGWFFDNIVTRSYCLHRWYSMSRQKNSILINEHSLNRKTAHGYSPAKNVYACSAKNDTWSISGNVIGSEAKMPAKCCSDESSDGSFFWQWQSCKFLTTVKDQKLFGQSFDVSVFSREYSVLKLAKNRIGMVWSTVIDVEIAGLHLEDMPKR